MIPRPVRMSTPIPIVWTVAGSDSGGGAGLQGDLCTLNRLGVHGCCVVTAVTAQSTWEVRRSEPLPADLVRDQAEALRADLVPAAVKIGMLGTAEVVRETVRIVADLRVPVVCDPVIRATRPGRLLDENGLSALREELLPWVTVLTPNLNEAATLLARPIETDREIEAAAEELLARGPASVVITGGHRGRAFAQDYWTNGRDRFWLTSPRTPGSAHGSGCVFASALAAGLAHGMTIPDSLVLAKAYVRQAIRTAPAIGAGDPPARPGDWPASPEDLPWLTAGAGAGRDRPAFPAEDRLPYGLYPIVDSLEALQRILPLGLRIAQLRIKDPGAPRLEETVAAAVRLARAAGCALYINDHWELAIRHQADGVHLGQDDLSARALDAIRAAGLRLGVSTHSYREVARATALRPTYIALGTVYPSFSKILDYVPLGPENFARIRRLVDAPVVAIGGMTLERGRRMREAGADGCAAIAEIARSRDPDATVHQWRQVFGI